MKSDIKKYKFYIYEHKYDSICDQEIGEYYSDDILDLTVEQAHQLEEQLRKKFLNHENQSKGFFYEIHVEPVSTITIEELNNIVDDLIKEEINVKSKNDVDDSYMNFM